MEIGGRGDGRTDGDAQVGDVMGTGSLSMLGLVSAIRKTAIAAIFTIFFIIPVLVVGE